MRESLFPLSRFPAARAFIAGAAMLAGLAAERAYAQTPGDPNTADDTAYAVPRVAPRGAGVALPQPLPPSEAARIRRIFLLQTHGDIAEAVRETEMLDKDVTLTQGVLGHLLAQRHLGRYTHPPADELQAWLDRWPTLPDAPAIHALLRARLPRGVRPPPPPPAFALGPLPPRPDNQEQPGASAAPIPEETEPAGMTLARSAALDRAVREAARGGKPFAAQRLIAGSKGLPPVYAAVLRGEAAQILFTQNRDEEAYETGAAGCPPEARPSCQAALPGFAAGLAAWRLGRIGDARAFFEAAARAAFSTSAQRAASAYWAARTHLRQQDYASGTAWLQRAAEQPSTFYGLLARRSLGLGLNLSPGARELLAQADIDAVAATPQGERAFALLQVGQTTRAEAELRRLWPDVLANPTLGRAVMLVATTAGFPALAAQFADFVQVTDGRPRANLRFPIPTLQPAASFTIDPALLYALARTESNFDAAMVSSAGARGLLQIMPDTAKFIVQTSGNAAGGFGDIRHALHDPEFNLEMGQRYIGYLATMDFIDGNLIKLLSSYNCGPTGTLRWMTNMRDGNDPLLFIESIPVDETRAYVPRVLSYTWIYAARLHLPAPTLDELAAGMWPQYHAPDIAKGEPARLH
jgi:soluble lytic murein transglycosylase-like protein